MSEFGECKECYKPARWGANVCAYCGESNPTMKVNSSDETWGESIIVMAIPAFFIGSVPAVISGLATWNQWIFYFLLVSTPLTVILLHANFLPRWNLPYDSNDDSSGSFKYFFAPIIYSILASYFFVSKFYAW